MAVYSQFNPASWDYRYWGQADPRAYPDYWADPSGSLLAQAMQAGLGWTAPRQLPLVEPRQELPLIVPNPPQSAPPYATRLERSWLGDVADAVAGPNGYPARAAQAISNAGRRYADYQEAYANSAPGWVEGIF